MFRLLAVALTVASVSAIVDVSHVSARSTTPPNVVLILTDDV